jgi:hypothetical protein
MSSTIDVAEAKVNQVVAEAIVKCVESVLLLRLDASHVQALKPTPRTPARFGLEHAELETLRGDVKGWMDEPDRPLTLEVHRTHSDSAVPTISGGVSSSLAERWVFAFTRPQPGDEVSYELPTGERLIAELRRMYQAMAAILRCVYSAAVASAWDAPANVRHVPPTPPTSAWSVTYRLIVSHPSRLSPHASTFPSSTRCSRVRIPGARTALGTVAVSLDYAPLWTLPPPTEPVRSQRGSVGGEEEEELRVEGLQNLNTLLQDDWFSSRHSAAMPAQPAPPPPPPEEDNSLRREESHYSVLKRSRGMHLLSAEELAQRTEDAWRYSPKMEPVAAPLPPVLESLGVPVHVPSRSGGEGDASSRKKRDSLFAMPLDQTESAIETHTGSGEAEEVPLGSLSFKSPAWRRLSAKEGSSTPTTPAMLPQTALKQLSRTTDPPPFCMAAPATPAMPDFSLGDAAFASSKPRPPSLGLGLEPASPVSPLAEKGRSLRQHPVGTPGPSDPGAPLNISVLHLTPAAHRTVPPSPARPKVPTVATILGQLQATPTSGPSKQPFPVLWKAPGALPEEDFPPFAANTGGLSLVGQLLRDQLRSRNRDGDSNGC